MTAPPSLHHIVFAVSPQRQHQTVSMFTELGFTFNTTDLTELGVRVHLDWDHGVELISPIAGSSGEVAASVNDFLDRHGDGVYTVVVRVPDASDAEAVATGYGATVRFRQSFSGDGSYLHEVDLSVLGLPLTLLATNVS
ncbi:hypothetical protein CRI77_03770 [Mycolicibacterium duvalii]|uniref:Uncharacterized protein n=1 Tax=Mycolicibacterium duvalii TaxID=39688 RepID=A0A7I7K8E9_9MYCO|nr:hypothetical protein [Mycolicibacterium duvalii]MCV7366508.1 hypothetical protein [Mycolicibacterium duvalii]PEG43711.1 hypothetical protein CRI77_03770 [Mycolicibacterium duvalii]BBX20336.1 hypothetical protein MDUV_51960 [Mycolicibacterium duvalii]